MRIGHGYDVHKLISGRKLILGGIEVPFNKGLDGHSDADVLLHATMDAVLGALGAGDIGTHFPDTDQKYKNISSLVLLAEVVELMRRGQYHLGNLDILLHADEPKVAGYIAAMKAKIADVFECNLARVNVKATTWEGLGYVGRGEGMAASAVCLLFPDTWDENSEDMPFGTGHLYFDYEDDQRQPVGKPPKGRLSAKPGPKDFWVANVDGASKGNPGPSAVGIVIRDPDGIVMAEISERIGNHTNNVAEYTALLRALKECVLLKAPRVLVRTDSELMARQMNGVYKVKNEKLIPLYEKAVIAVAAFDKFKIEHIPRTENCEADELANQAIARKK